MNTKYVIYAEERRGALIRAAAEADIERFDVWVSHARSRS